jgi:hypothetical protein
MRREVAASFVEAVRQLRDVLVRYRAEDVVLASTVSELWLPNITSQVKHQLLLRLAVSTQASDYTGDLPLESHEDLTSFLGAVYAALPDFPSLEDYAPEMDWGEVSIDVRDAFVPVLYGGNVERITDFVTAFRMVQIGNLPANHDMDVALWMQSYVVTHIHTQPDARLIDVKLGHLEVPPQEFWTNCRDVLLSAGAQVTKVLGSCSKELTIELGFLRAPDSSDAFGNSVLEGSALPALMVRIGDALFPLSLRNGPSVVLETWANRMIGTIDEQLLAVSHALSVFLVDRFPPNDIVIGPLIPCNREQQLPYVLAAAFVCGEKLFLVAPGNIHDRRSVLRLCRAVSELVSSGGEGQWGFKHLRKSSGVTILRGDGKAFSKTDVTFLIVPIDVTTQTRLIPGLEKPARLIPMADFVTVFDSLNDVSELGQFLAYIDDNRKFALGPFAGFSDLFGSFRDTHGLLVDGAVQPTMISLDPHWGSNWRFKQLSEFWESAPLDFPNSKATWLVEPRKGGLLTRMVSKGRPVLSWTTTIGSCSVHAVFPFISGAMDSENGHLLETFVHCAADSLSQRQGVIAAISIFRRPRITFVCRPDASTFVGSDVRTVPVGALEKPLLSNVQLVSEDANGRIMLGLEVNLSRVQQGILGATDAAFEADCALELLRSVAGIVGQKIDADVVDQINATSKNRPRFLMHQTTRDADVPDHAQPTLPLPSDYKRARRDLAVVFRDIEAVPGRYDLAQAKVLIDRARDAYRATIHGRIRACNLNALLVFCVEQHDTLIAEYRSTTSRVQMSLAHDVDFSRAETVAKAHDHFTKNARNYRYLIEAALSLSALSEMTGDAKVSVDLVAAIDWLFVLYGASDVLHNGIYPAGVNLDHNYVPEVFFSDDLRAKEQEFALEQANLKLGTELSPRDEIRGLEPGEGLTRLDQSFRADLGFSLSNLVQCMITLARWASARSSGDLKFSYQASIADIVAALLRSVESLSDDEAVRIVRFVTIDPTRVRQLLGKVDAESDVPIWEHNKRDQRLTIRPLIPLSTGSLLWGAACAERAGSIWIGSVSDGYLPADFSWPAVKTEVRNVKEGIENELERRAHEICARATPYLSSGIDFMRRFSDQGFEDVGDFDVLAFWPDTNRWIVVECKYNQPPFCLKDARRLRDRIFGAGRDPGHFEKIDRRHRFLKKHMDKLRELLRWPASLSNSPPAVLDVYVAREIYWWMRNPPYQVGAQFVRIDTFDGWLRAEGLLRR